LKSSIFLRWASAASSEALTPSFHLSIAVCACACAQVIVPANASSAPSAFAQASAAAYHLGGWVLTAVRSAWAVSPLSREESRPLRPSPASSKAVWKARSLSAVAVTLLGLP
jgi:hypothetical protein